jgi:hypothetical protein
MSRILDKLQAAEAQRQSIIAERRRLEAEADAALAAQDREARAPHLQADPPQSGIPAPVRRPLHFPWTWALAAIAFLAVAIVVLPEKKRAPAAPAAAAAPPAFGLKLDHNVDAFAARLRATEKP